MTAEAATQSHSTYRVAVRRPTDSDREPWLAAVRRSAEHLSVWNPISTDDTAFDDWMSVLREPNQDAFLVIDKQDGEIAARVTIMNITYGLLHTASLGYSSYLPYAGTGRMTEGLRLVIARCFAPMPAGLSLHRLEIAVQPENQRSVAMATRLGFDYEGLARRYMYLGGAWRDHERYALTVEDHRA